MKSKMYFFTTLLLIVSFVIATGCKKGVIDESDGSSFPKTFATRVHQTGTNAPVATVIVNSLNLTITWSRTSQGRFKGPLNQHLDMSKSILLTNNIAVLCKFQSGNEITLDNSCGVNAYCDNFSDLNLEIKVY